MLEIVKSQLCLGWLEQLTNHGLMSSFSSQVSATIA
jgi:hypothetical protein